ncbi:MAG: hypothetical protein ACRDNF_27060, partial [Streptosporangiaceae bacterium]
VLVIGFAAALEALGSLSSSDFIALVIPMGAMLAMAAASNRGNADAPRRAGHDRDAAGPEL